MESYARGKWVILQSSISLDKPNPYINYDLQKFGLLSNEEIDPSQVVDVPKQLLPDIKACFNLLPKRRIVDCLVQHFLKEVNWIYELVHSSNLLTRYESWWTALAVNQIEEVEFCVLLLRICAYSAQFLPSRAYTADTICGVSITSIREHCSRVASGLSRVYESTGGPRSLTGVQHLSFAACYLMNEGRMKEAWYVIGDAIRLAQDLGMHLEVTAAATATQSHFNDLEKEMRIKGSLRSALPIILSVEGLFFFHVLCSAEKIVSSVWIDFRLTRAF